jgi:energy-coupling factor transport system permease protein
VIGRPVLAEANPAAKLVAALAVSVVLLLSVDVVTAATALGLEASLLPWCGLSPGGLARRLRVAMVPALALTVATALFGVDSGSLVWAAGPVSVSTGSVAGGAAIGLRILAIGLPGVVLLATTDPTDLADALAQVVRLPHRFVLSALAGMRLFGVLAQEWQALGMARRARGVADGGALGRVRVAGAQVFALLVLAIRRATVLAVTMESRGFGVSPRRTWARPSRLTRRDALVAAGGLALAATATAAGVLAGTWHLVLAGA